MLSEIQENMDVTETVPISQTADFEMPSSSGFQKVPQTDFDFVTPARSGYSKNVDDAMKYKVMQNPYDREHWMISADHCYARPWNWRPESSFLRPTKTLFIPKIVTTKRKSSNPLAPLQDCDDIIDVEGEADEPPPVYDVSKAKTLMEECEKYAFSVRAESLDEEYWEDKISKVNWTSAQLRIYQGFVNILNSFHMAKLAQSGARHEPILRRTIIDKAVQRIRRLMATVSWDFKIVQWIHQLMIENLSREYLAAYLDILQTLRFKLPNFVEKAIYGLSVSGKMNMLSGENLFPLLKKPWDPVAPSLQQDKPKKLPGNPIIIVVPSVPTTSKRIHKWITLLSNLATVVSIPTNWGSAGNRMTMVHFVDQMFVTTRSKIQEIRSDYPGRNIVLVGFNAGATLALQIATVEPVLCVVCLGFSLLTAEGRRGEPDDNILELQHPVLFVIGQCSNTSLQEDMEDLRERMRVETGLIVVGSADDHLRVNKKKKRAEGITQSIVDRCIVDEIGEFISGVILSPFPPQIRQSPTHITTDPSSGLIKKSKSERKRYNSNASSLDSEPPSPTLRITRPGQSSNSYSSLGRPPGSKAKSKLEAKWAAQIAQGTTTPHSPSPSSSPPPPIYTPDTSSNDSSLAEKTTKPESSVKKIKTLRPVEKTTKPTVNTPTKSQQQPQQQNIISAKLQAYGFNRSVMTGGQLSSLLQGGIKTLPPTQPKSSSGIKVLENVTLNSSTTAKLISNSGRTIDLSKITVINPMNAAKTTGNMGNVILLPDGKLQTVHGGSIKGSKYITSKRQLIGNKPPRPVKKIPYLHQTPLPPPTNLTTQDIMDLPIIFADDNQILDPPISEPVQIQQPPKLLTTPGNKFVLVNKQVGTASNFIISPNTIKKTSPINLNAKQPKYTKIILSKRNSQDEAKPPPTTNIITKITSLPPEISIRKVPSATSVQTSMNMEEHFDLENELVATAVPKPNLATSDVKNITIIKQSGGMQSPLRQILTTEESLKRPKPADGDGDDPDYIPPKNMKLDKCL